CLASLVASLILTGGPWASTTFAAGCEEGLCVHLHLPPDKVLIDLNKEPNATIPYELNLPEKPQDKVRAHIVLLLFTDDRLPTEIIEISVVTFRAGMTTRTGGLALKEVRAQGLSKRGVTYCTLGAIFEVTSDALKPQPFRAVDHVKVIWRPEQ